MSSLTPIGEILVRAQARDATAEVLQAAHEEISAEFQRSRDEGGAMLQFGFLALLAIERVRMGESHERSTTSDPAGRSDSGLAPVYAIGGGWRTPRSTPPTL